MRKILLTIILTMLILTSSPCLFLKSKESVKGQPQNTPTEKVFLIILDNIESDILCRGEVDYVSFRIVEEIPEYNFTIMLFLYKENLEEILPEEGLMSFSTPKQEGLLWEKY